MFPGIFRGFLACVLTLSAHGSQAEWTDWSMAARAWLDTDDNVNIAPSGAERDDESLSLGAALGRSYMPESSAHSNSRIGWKLDVEQRWYDRYDDLSTTSVGGLLRYHHKFGLGITAPRLSFTASGKLQRVRDDNRDAAHAIASVALDKRLSPRLDLGVQAHYRLREGESWTPVAAGVNSKVYDSEHVELALTARFSLLPRLRWSARGSYFDGEFDSDCDNLLEPGSGGRYGGGLANLGKEPDYASFGVKAIAVDEVFGCRWLADGDGFGASTELLWSISAKSSLRLRAAWREISLDDYEEYSNVMLGLGFQRSF